MVEQKCIWNEKKELECPYLIDNCTYSVMGWILLSIGISATPTHIKRECSNCNRLVQEISDPVVLNKYTGR